MPPIRAVKNQYRGINAHLHSEMQAHSTWITFHNSHISHLAEQLSIQLRPLGYIADIEQSVQIRRLDRATEHHPQADVLITRLQSPAESYTGISAAPELTVEMALYEEDTEHPYTAVVIYAREADLQRGEPIVWIELLSPTNKGSTSDASYFLGKRRLILETGIVFLELDYLHETPSTFHIHEDYTNVAHRDTAHPYRIVLLDPRPNFKRGPVDAREFDVDVPIPTIRMPLAGTDSILFDFNAVYQYSFERRFMGDRVDYSTLPLNFERYSAADQTRIARRMLAVLQAAQAGVDLETAPLPVDESLTLADAQKQIETLKKEK